MSSSTVASRAIPRARTRSVAWRALVPGSREFAAPSARASRRTSRGRDRAAAAGAAVAFVKPKGEWPRVNVAGERSWKGIQFDELSFEVKKCEDGAAATALVDEFVRSDGLTPEFLETCVDLTVLAHKQRRPAEEIAMLQELAVYLMREHRRRACPPEVFFADELLRTFDSETVAAAMRGDEAASIRVRNVRDALVRAFEHGVADVDDPDDDAPAVRLSQSVFMTHLERTRFRCVEDARRERSVAMDVVGADELGAFYTLVPIRPQVMRAYEPAGIDTMEEIRMSRDALLEAASRVETLAKMFKEHVWKGGGASER
ncbi:uncharacterized protein MICPUCDRAFT_60146 [Micromonas pusilla CCMP1545]|uniref:Predicted protein n=1 Tax=Micromonas pusilla (strain CCMP1545) TaxID=564608 RepID=C1MXG1_MICPC|nr:uncharacterized protein MICPUCDRAFT_60146 [Micromonas pusilla CCMP1545]EEH55455.1 predicted protein [Micromonas pusilla CCMP1545]|eukprot:XP_003060686.1 predicted protein [Micromonas pusilla CCMP1545]